MKIQSIETKDIVINPAIASRKGAPDEENVQRLADSFISRHAAGLEPIQMQPGLVRSVNGHYELIAGRHRYEAVKLVNEAGGLDGEEMQFEAIVARADDEGGLVSSIQENFHAATTVFDRADAMAKLSALGKKNNEIASIFGMSEATVSQMLKLNDLPKKYVKAVQDGDIEQDAAVMIADLDTSDALRQEIFEESIRHSQRYADIMARKETKAAKAEVASKIEQAKAELEEAEIIRKEAAKAAKEAEKEAAKTKDEKELAKVREAEAAAKKALKEAEKTATAKQKALEKAKAEKVKLVEANKPKASVEDVKEAAKAKGVNKLKPTSTNKKGKTLEPTPRTAKQMYAALEALGEDAKTPLPKSAVDLIGKIEAFMDGEATEAQLENAFRKFCVPDGK